ncbi:hypothetical protein IFM89_013701 [Coptis chinensis]|uniref:Uncharacterized protein n=1 Tax=Coptis chinensis TaxID=261450 RepID=A0A835GWC9_9MAGN|nr:hypothetical protein IFM89_013701 [Coptis chinensis]
MKSSVVSSKSYLLVTSLVFLASAGNDRGEPRGSQASRSSAPPKILPIEMPAISLDELKRLTSNFRTKDLVGEGSYSRVFSATSSTGESTAVKNLDLGNTQEPDSDFAAQEGREYRGLHLALFSARTKESTFHITSHMLSH